MSEGTELKRLSEQIAELTEAIQTLRESVSSLAEAIELPELLKIAEQHDQRRAKLKSRLRTLAAKSPVRSKKPASPK